MLGVRGACVLLTVALLVGCGDAPRPISSAVELRVRQLYDAKEWLQRVPVELAISLYARSKLEGFLDDLELQPELDGRLRQRLGARDFVDELVPFLLFLYEMYQPEGPPTFDEHVRETFSPGDGIPGIEHDLFQFRPGPNGASTALPRLEPDVVAQLLVFYDALYLRDGAATGISERLACQTRTVESGLQEAVLGAEPAVTSLLELLKDRLGEQADLGAAVDGVLGDPSRLQAATAALIRFIDQTVCRNYRFFATRAHRTRQLESWMIAELDAPGGGELWDYLEWAQNQRRHGVVIVVDGLQGALVDALVSGDPASPFLRTILAEQEAAGGVPPVAKSLRAPAAQQTDFVLRLASEGFSHESYLPFFRALRTNPHAHWFPVGVSTTPTISVRNIPIAMTGAPVAGAGGTGLPNFHFVERGFEKDGERRGRAYYFYGSDAVDLVDLTREAGMKTLFERLPHLGSMSCTAQYDELSHHGIDALLNLGLGERLRDFGERLCTAELELRVANERELSGLRFRLLGKRGLLGTERAWYRFWQRLGDEQDRALALQWIREIARLEQRTLPELLVYYNPWPDHFAHFEGPFADAILSPSGELNRLDYWVGRVQAAYARTGALSRTVFGMAGDHGLSPVFHLLNPEVEVFDALRAEGVDFRVEKISSDEGEGPKLTNPFDPPSMKGIDVVVASTAGGNVMFDLFVDQDDAFTRQPLASELRAVRPLAHPGAEPIDLLDEIATRLADSLDYLVVRERPCSPDESAVRIVGTRAGVRSSATIERRGGRLRYVTEGVDLLGTDQPSPYEALDDAAQAEHASLRARCMAASEAEPESWCNEREWRHLTSYTARPDSVVQLAHLFDSDRAGTINLFPRAGVGYNSGVPGRHAGESFHEKDAFVAVWGAPLARVDSVPLERSVVNGSMPMTIFAYLAGETPERGVDGWGYDPIDPAILRR